MIYEIIINNNLRMSSIKGWIYCFKNKGLNTVNGKPLYKVGYTENDPKYRAKTLCTTGVPDKFETMFAINVSNYKKHEKYIHFELAEYRYNLDREYFDVDLKNIRNIFTKICFEYDGEWYKEEKIDNKSKNDKYVSVQELLFDEEKLDNKSISDQELFFDLDVSDLNQNHKVNGAKDFSKINIGEKVRCIYIPGKKNNPDNITYTIEFKYIGCKLFEYKDQKSTLHNFVKHFFSKVNGHNGREVTVWNKCKVFRDNKWIILNEL